LRGTLPVSGAVHFSSVKTSQLGASKVAPSAVYGGAPVVSDGLEDLYLLRPQVLVEAGPHPSGGVGEPRIRLRPHPGAQGVEVEAGPGAHGGQQEE